MKKQRLTTQQIEEIKRLRYQGYSLPEISKELAVSKTTAFRYVQNAPIAAEFLAEWKGKRGGSIKLMRSKEKKSLEDAQKEFAALSEKEKKLFLAALYWGEGSKKSFGLSNTDPDLIRIFIIGLREVFGVAEERLRISIRIYEDLDRDVCLAFWSDIVKIPREQFVNVDVLSGKKKGKLAYGMCRVRVTKGGNLLKQIKAICKVTSNVMSL